MVLISFDESLYTTYDSMLSIYLIGAFLSNKMNMYLFKHVPHNIESMKYLEIFSYSVSHEAQCTFRPEDFMFICSQLSLSVPTSPSSAEYEC